MRPLDVRDLTTVYQYAETPDSIASMEFFQAAKCIMEENNMHMPQNIESAMNLYVLLTTTIEEHI